MMAGLPEIQRMYFGGDKGEYKNGLHERIRQRMDSINFRGKKYGDGFKHCKKFPKWKRSERANC